jgi:polysaccharide export outer membrane protein
MDLPNNADTIMHTVAPSYESKIKHGDILSLNVTPLDALSNMSAGGGSGVAFSSQTIQLNSPQGTGYAVDKAGMIEAPLVGQVKVSDLTIDQAKEVLRAKYALFYKTFTIYVAYLNHKITVLGEVGNPGSFTIPSDQTTIFDAIGMAGDITLNGKRENILLVRDSTNNQKHLVRLDLNSKNIISSPYYYLKENDILYVEPTKSRLISTDAYRTRNITIFLATLSFILILTRTIK